MSSGVFYPYPVVEDGITLELEVPELDVPRGDDGTLLLYQLEAEAYKVRASMLVLDSTVDQIDVDKSELELWLIARNPEARYRDGWRLGREELVEKTFTWHRDNWRGTLDLQAVYVHGDTSTRPRGTRVAWSPVRRVHFTEPRTPPGHNLRITWRDFQHEKTLEHLATHLFTVKQSGPSDEPEILLNQGVEGLYDVLMSQGTHGAKARIRDAVYMQLVHQVWTSVLAGVLQNIYERFSEEDSIEPEDVLGNLETWQAGMIRSWSTSLKYGDDRDDATARLLEDVCSSSGLGVIADLMINHVPDAIQKRFGTRKAFDGLMRDARLLQ